MLSRAKNVVFNVRGLMPAVFTPLKDDQTVNCGIIPAYAQYLVNNGIKAVLVGGSTGEHMSLSVKDRKKVIDAWVDTSRTTGLHVQVQVGGAPFPDVIELAKYCASSGVNSILTLPELYFRPDSVAELVSYVEMVANAAPNLPVLYYHIPRMSNVAINMPAFAAAASAQLPNFKGMKFTSSDLIEAAQVVKVLKEDQQIFLGGEYLLAPGALLGIKSCISTPINIFPQLVQGVLDAVERSDVTEANKLQDKLTVAIDSIASEGGWVPTMKAAMEFVTGINVGPPSLPKKPLSSEAKKKIEGKLLNLGYCN
ncbi:N-acetylneuraminate lyase-like [Pectinophora gossypiella]|uniref:N-acetylneuraminate lyase-like n=1 Tax=Pectinophora gossypiella TaxID=13191 RepID=UPI00214E94FE|nr:N-acetylneuraminate lyase-like [Pectinophora gossypiella]